MSTTTAPAGALRREEQAPQHNRQAAQGHLGLAPDRRIMSRHSAGLRLTRRGRVVLLVLLLLAVLAAFSMGRATGSADAASSSPPPASVVVRPGDTLWSIAQQVAPDADPRQVIPRLKAANGLTSSRLDVGQRLRVPGARSMVPLLVRGDTRLDTPQRPLQLRRPWAYCPTTTSSSYTRVSRPQVVAQVAHSSRPVVHTGIHRAAIRAGRRGVPCGVRSVSMATIG